MRVVYVGDNRNRGNYGCRGTSTALSQLISQNNEIVGRISGRYTNYDTGNLYFKRGISKSKYERLSHRSYWKYEHLLRHYYHRFLGRGGKFLLSKYDFVTLDFEKSIQNLINCLPANPELKEFDLRQYDFDALVVNGEGSFIFATPAWKWRESIIEAMEMYAKIIKDGMPPQSTMAETSNNVLFMSNMSAMGMFGSWYVPSFVTFEDVEKWGIAELPYHDANGNGQCDEGERVSIYNGLGWAANAKTEDPDTVYSLLSYLGSKEGQTRQAELGVTMRLPRHF